MNKFERIVDIKEGVKFKLESKEVDNKVLVYGTVMYDDGINIPYKSVVAKTEGTRSYYFWTNEHIYIRSEIGTINNYVFDIDNRKVKKIYISPTDRKYAFGRVLESSSRSITYDNEYKINDEATLLVDRYWNGSDLCESASLFYNSDKQVVTLPPVINCTPADYEVPTYYLWDNEYVYICYDGVNDKVKVELYYDINNRKKHLSTIERDNEYMLSLVKNK